MSPYDLNPHHPLAFIGFGEAAQAFVEGMGDNAPAGLCGYDLKSLSDNPVIRAAKAADFAHFNVTGTASNAEAISGASVVFCLVTADQALAAALAAAAGIQPGAVYFDGNSVSPQTKRLAAEAIEAAGGRYVDAAIMSPVRPALTAAPLLLSGPHADPGAEILGRFGFSKVRVMDGPVGSSSAVKMIRSVMVKGIEALTAECLSAAVAAGVDQEVLASLDASDKPQSWITRGDYNLDRMMVHGGRRAEEMREVVATLEELGVTPAMSRGTVAWQAAIGAAGLNPPPQGYAPKVAAIRKAKGLP
jgi:3-hydroxyisobutyrate dehydrogenase-like beta-hydroxyacid dehydrogenase